VLLLAHNRGTDRKIALRTVGPRRTVPASDENPGPYAAVRQQPSPPEDLCGGVGLFTIVNP